MAKNVPPPRISRSEFTNIVLAILGSIITAIVGLPIIGYIISPALKAAKRDEWVTIGPLENYAIGEPGLITFTRTQKVGWERNSTTYGIYVVRQSEDELIALSNWCTHLSCRVTWNPDTEEYKCPCHDGAFDIDGDVLYGPPPRPMDPFEYKVEDGEIMVHLTEG
jgi:Rieske Fe-S protein